MPLTILTGSVRYRCGFVGSMVMSFATYLGTGRRLAGRSKERAPPRQDLATRAGARPSRNSASGHFNLSSILTRVEALTCFQQRAAPKFSWVSFVFLVTFCVSLKTHGLSSALNS